MRCTRWLVTLPAALIGYSYVAYPLLIELTASHKRKTVPAIALPDRLASALPTVTVVVAAFNEEDVIEGKIDDLLAQDYPASLVRILVVADGSTDGTVDRSRAKGVEVLWRPERRGKSDAVNRGIAASYSEIVCLTDANCRLAPRALRAVVAPFEDPEVAVVSGAKTIVGASSAARGEGLYWKIEARLKKAESSFGATAGAVGEICALRRQYTRPIPPGTINDDYHLTCDALARGYRVKYAPDAIASEPMSPTARDEFERRTRVAAGTWQTTVAHLALADPRRGAVAWVFLSHRVLRSLIVPPMLPVWLAATVCGRKDRLGRAALAGQVLLYATAAGAVRSRSRVLAAPYAFVSTNLATLRGAIRYLRKSQPAAWKRVDRIQPAKAPEQAQVNSSVEASL